MNALKGSRSARIFAGIALVSASALIIAGCSSTPDAEPSDGGGDKPAADLTLKLGSLLPATGTLAFLGAPMEAGVQLAVNQINEADAGITIDLSTGDEGDLDNKAYETSITNLRNGDITAMIGAASSSVTKLILDGNAGADILTVSPSNTSPDFTGINPLYFRTAPSDNLQGEVLGNEIAEDGHKTLGIIYQNDPYGTGLFEAIKATFESTGGEVVADASYNQGDGQFNAQVSEIAAANRTPSLSSPTTSSPPSRRCWATPGSTRARCTSSTATSRTGAPTSRSASRARRAPAPAPSCRRTSSTS